MIKIGANELIESHTFLAMDDEEIYLETVVDDWPLKITLILSSSKNNGPPSINWVALSENHAKITFNGWSNASGIVTPSPVHLGMTDTTHRKVLFSACNQRIGSINRVDFQVYLGEKA